MASSSHNSWQTLQKMQPRLPSPWAPATLMYFLCSKRGPIGRGRPVMRCARPQPQASSMNSTHASHDSCVPDPHTRRSRTRVGCLSLVPEGREAGRGSPPPRVGVCDTRGRRPRDSRQHTHTSFHIGALRCCPRSQSRGIVRCFYHSHFSFARVSMRWWWCWLTPGTFGTSTSGGIGDRRGNPSESREDTPRKMTPYKYEPPQNDTI
mmetsp:Transcript_22213/g.64502  ORF Transcript_22213/g.64502 Transcript_22213/m.64502 type:complete len:207 (+) Transcript_22213:2014-2634(+)